MDPWWVKEKEDRFFNTRVPSWKKGIKGEWRKVPNYWKSRISRFRKTSVPDDISWDDSFPDVDSEQMEMSGDSSTLANYVSDDISWDSTVSEGPDPSTSLDDSTTEGPDSSTSESRGRSRSRSDPYHTVDERGRRRSLSISEMRRDPQRIGTIDAYSPPVSPMTSPRISRRSSPLRAPVSTFGRIQRILDTPIEDITSGIISRLPSLSLFGSFRGNAGNPPPQGVAMTGGSIKMRTRSRSRSNSYEIPHISMETAEPFRSIKIEEFPIQQTAQYTPDETPFKLPPTPEFIRRRVRSRRSSQLASPSDARLRRTGRGFFNYRKDFYSHFK